MLVRNYGLFWKRRDIWWGSPGVEGHLKGFPASAAERNADLVDFSKQQGVYALYDENFGLVYVGQAGGGDTYRLIDRLRNHRQDQLADRWSMFSWFGVIPVTTVEKRLRVESQAKTSKIADVLNHIEAILLAVAEPPHNRQGGRFGDAVEQYRQHRDPGLGPSLEEMVRELWGTRAPAIKSAS
jgi:hypothetical protein